MEDLPNSIPEKRNYKIIIKDIIKNGRQLVINLENADVTKAHSFEFDNIKRAENPKPYDEVIRILSRWQEKSMKKNDAYKPFENLYGVDEIRNANKKARLPKEIKLAIDEILSE